MIVSLSRTRAAATETNTDDVASSFLACKHPSRSASQGLVDAAMTLVTINMKLFKKYEELKYKTYVHTFLQL